MTTEETPEGQSMAEEPTLAPVMSPENVPDEYEPAASGPTPPPSDTSDEREPAMLDPTSGPVRQDYSHLGPTSGPVPVPPAGEPVAMRGTSDGTLVCTVCLRLIGAGEAYVQTEVRGINHLDPCSHRA